MGLIAGTVTGFSLDSRGNPTFTGTANSLALGFAQNRASARLVGAGLPSVNPLPTLGQKTAPYSPQAPASPFLISQVLTTVRAIYTGVVAESNADAATIVAHFQAHGSITVSVPATGIDDSTHNPCTGTATGTGTIS